MRKLRIEDSEVVRMVIQQEIGRSDESRYDHRLHCLLLLAGGHSCPQVAALFGEDDTTVQRWAHRFSQGGLSALRERERPGRPPTLSQAQWSLLDADLRRSPHEFGLARACWDGRTLSEFLRLRYGVALGVRQCQRIARQMRFRPGAAASRVTDRASSHDSQMTTGTRTGTAA